MLPPNNLYARVTRIIAECSNLGVHLIAAQVKMPAQKFNQSGEQVILRTELDAIGYIRGINPGDRGTIVVIELKTSLRSNGYNQRFFTERGNGIGSLPGFKNTLFCRHMVQVLFGMHCVDDFRTKFKLNKDDNIAGLLLYSQGNGCTSRWVRHPAAGISAPGVNQMWENRRLLFSQTRLNPQQNPLATAKDRVKQNFLTTTWWKTSVVKWPTGERADAMQRALFKDTQLKNFSRDARRAQYVPEDVDFPCVSAVFRHRIQSRIRLYVCIVTRKFAGTKKSLRLNQLCDSISATSGSMFVILVQTTRPNARNIKIGWRIAEKKVI